jgi:hypothetical protein
MLTAAGVFTAPVTDPAWKVKPSWALVADADDIINPDLERFYAAHSHVVEVKGARLMTFDRCLFAGELGYDGGEGVHVGLEKLTMIMVIASASGSTLMPPASKSKPACSIHGLHVPGP